MRSWRWAIAAALLGAAAPVAPSDRPAGEGFVATVTKVPFHTLADDKKLKYLDFLATQLPGDQLTKRDVPLVFFFHANCSACAEYFHKTIWQLKTKNLGARIRLSYAIVSTSSTDFANSVTAFCVAGNSGMGLYSYQLKVRELAEMGIPMTDTSRTISFPELLKKSSTARDSWRDYQNEYSHFFGRKDLTDLGPGIYSERLKIRDNGFTVGSWLGLNDEFEKCVKSGRAAAAIKENARFEDELEIVDLPTLFVGTTEVEGLPNLVALVGLLREEMKKPIYARPR